jgi:hypothetical protein
VWDSFFAIPINLEDTGKVLEIDTLLNGVLTQKYFDFCRSLDREVNINNSILYKLGDEFEHDEERKWCQVHGKG